MATKVNDGIYINSDIRNRDKINFSVMKKMSFPKNGLSICNKHYAL